MKVLICIYPFLTIPEEQKDIVFLNPWSSDPTPDQIEEEMVKHNCECLIIGTKRVNNSLAERCPSLKVISRVGVGYNNIDVEFFKKHGVITTYTPFGPTDSTAEMALALMLAGTRHLITYDRGLRNGVWKREFHLRMKDSTVGIVGFGRIGKRLATLLKADMATAHALGLSFVDKEELLKRSDIISFHVPLKQDTVDWLSDPELGMLNRPVTMVNTARGGIINEKAVYGYLKDHPESYYCCDVFEDEPYAGPLTELDNVLLTPHASSFTVGSRRQTEELAIDNCLRVLRGQPCNNIVEKNE